MDNESSSYKKTVKSTAVFGGAQAIQMLVTVLRAKFIAVILGSHGMGVNAIFQSTIAILSSLSSFGIFQSAVRDISQVHEGGSSLQLSRMHNIFVRMVWLAGILGMVICLICSFWMSKLAFENYDYTWHFALLSVALLFSALSNGQTAFLQGTRNLTHLAKASLIGSIASVIIGIPLFYYFGIIGIVLSIVVGYALLFFTQLYFSRKINLVKVENISLSQTIKEGKPIVKLGTVLMLGMITLTGFTYLTNIFIGRYGNIEDVGFFQGVSSISTQSIAIVIAILASDFFPRLAAVYQDDTKIKVMVNQQAELVSLIIAPIVVLLLVFAPLIVKVLLSVEFLVVVPMLRLMGLSLLVRGIWLIMSYVILAKGDRKSYFIFDCFLGNGILFLLNVLAYAYWGLQGLGTSMLVGSIIVTILLFLVVKIKYGFSFNTDFVKIFVALALIIGLTYFTTDYFDGWIQYFFSGIFLGLIFICSFYILNSRIGIVQMVKSKFLIRK